MAEAGPVLLVLAKEEMDTSPEGATTSPEAWTGVGMSEQGHSVRQTGRDDASEKPGGHPGRQRSASSQCNFGGAPRASSGQLYGRYVRHAVCH